MSVSISKSLTAALLAGGLALSGPALTPAFAAMHHGGGHGVFHGGHGFHGGWHGHYAGGYGHHYYGGGGYYGGGYPGYGYGYYAGPGYYGYDPGWYGAPGCIPVLGIVTGNYCNGYW